MAKTRHRTFRRIPNRPQQPDNTAADYAAHFHEAPSGYLVLQPDGTILDVNQTFAAWTRNRREKLLGSNVAELLPAADQVLFGSYVVSQLGVAGSVNEVAVDLLCRGGEPLPVLLSAARTKLPKDKGSLDRITVVRASERLLHERDLTAALRKAEAAEAARAEVEAELREKQRALEEKNRILQENLAEVVAGKALMDTVFNATEVGLLVVDPQGNTVLANDHLSATWRTATGDLPDGQEGGAVFSADRTTPLPKAENPVRRATAGKSFSGQLLWLGSGEHQVAVTASAGPIKINGAAAGSVVAFHDVTKMARALAAQEKVLADLSHELRTPLTSVMGYLDLVLEDSRLPPHLAAALNVAARNSQRLLALLPDLLAVASDKNARPRHRPVNLAETVRTRIASVRRQADARNVDFLTEIPVSIVADVEPGAVAQVVGNLLANAVKYSPDGGTVYVQLWQKAQTVCLRIAGTRLGVSEAQPEGPATKSVRARRDQSAPGTGPVFDASREIIKEHGGSLTYVSSAGEGSVFTVMLPVSAETAALNRLEPAR